MTKMTPNRLGILLIIVGVLFNRWLVGIVLPSDAQISGVYLYFFQAVCIGLGAYITLKPKIEAKLPERITVPLRGDVVITCFCSIVLVIFAGIGYGFAIGKFDVYPARLIQKLLQSGKAWEAKYALGDKGWATHYHHVDEKGGAGVVTYHKDKASAGYTVFTDWECSARLINMRGEILHRWHKDLEEVVDLQKVVPGVDYRQYKHGFYWRKVKVLPSGKLLVIYNTGDFGKTGITGLLIKIDKKSNVIWKAKLNAHHDLAISEDGRIYVLDRKQTSGPDWTFYDTLTILSSSGHVIRKVSLVKAFQNSEYKSYLPDDLTGDFLHSNTVDLLDADIADEFPRFEQGDILLSFRNIHAVAVMDGDDFNIKWAERPFTTTQHDPDFLPDGRIMIFDNRYVPKGDDSEFRSRILSYDPEHGTVENMYSSPNFFTPACGSQQLLPNGNILITESYRGTIFEVTSKGGVVWKYRSVKQADRLFGEGEFIGDLYWAERYTEDYFTDAFKADWSRTPRGGEN